MEAADLHRLQFGFTISFHYLFPQLTMGLALLILILKTMALRGDVEANRAARFWLKVFGLSFALGVVTGIPMEFQFGTNWARFSKMSGGIIGQTLAMEGVFAFFLEAAFLYFLLYGEEQLGPRGHWVAALLVFLGSWLSGYFIVCTNAWMQHPVGFALQSDGSAKLTSFRALLTNRWAVIQYLHNMAGAAITGSFVMAGVAALYLLRGTHVNNARRFLSVGVIVGLVASVLAAVPTGDWEAKLVYKYQPATFAAMEAHFQTEDSASMVFIGQPNMESLSLDNPIKVPGLLSFLTHQRWNARVKGLAEFPREEWPQFVPLVYYSYHIMAGLGSMFILLMGLALFFLWRRTLFTKRLLLWFLMLASPFPFIANTLGWVTAEAGRQPWIIYGVLRTAQGSSQNVSSGNVGFTLFGFMGLYALLALIYFTLVLESSVRVLNPNPGRRRPCDMTELWFWLLIFMLGGYVVFGGSDLGVGMLSFLVTRNEEERSGVVDSIRPVWKPNEVWLVAAGGTMLLAFPTALAASFSGFYLALTIVVWLLAFRGLGLELRFHTTDPLWRQFWDVALSLGSLLLALFLGTALGNVVRGVPLNEQGVFFEPLWTDFRVGQNTGIVDWYTILAGITAVVALAHHGALWLNARTDGPVRERASRLAAPLGVTVILLLAVLDLASFGARLEFREAIRARPWGLLFPALTLGGLVAALILQRRNKPARAFIFSGIALFAALATAAVGIFPNILPARDPNNALSIHDATVSPDGLATALWWWVPGMLLVAGYFAFIHANMRKTFNRGFPVSK